MTKKDKLDQFIKVAKSLRDAADALEQVANDKNNDYYLCPDATYIRHQILEILSTDHDQAGLDVIIHKLNQQFEL